MTIRPEVVCTSRAPAAIGPYSQALRLGAWIFLSGQIALHPESGKLIDGGVGEQARRCMENARAVLRAADADFTDVIRAILYLRDMGDFEEVNRVYGEYFPEPEYGLCRNPWDLNRLAGYSSSGAAAAVAAGTDLASIGSDGGGSVRYPAACCGVVGLKPTFGRISRYGAGVYGIPNDYIGPLTRTARDCALVMQAIAGHDDRDPYSAPAPVPNYIEALDGDLKEIKVGIPNEHFWDYLDGEVESAVRSAISLLGELGCSVLEVSMPTMAMVNEIHTMLSEAETAAFYQPQMQHFTDETPGILFQRIERGAKVLAADYIRARKTRDQLNADIEAAFKEVDVLVTPTSILPAPPIGQFEFRHMGRTWVIGDLASRLTRPFNTSGHPAISVPCGFTHSGLPIGLQLVGPNFGEATLLKVADAYQRAAEQSTRWPSL